MRKIFFALLVSVSVACRPSWGGSVAPTAGPANPDAARAADSSRAVSESPTALSAKPNVTRHLPGTAIATATGKYTYLVGSDGKIAPFASAKVLSDSGYAANMVVTVSAEELYCYGRSPEISAAVPAPPGGKLRDGTLVKQKSSKDVYAVSDGVAWPVITGAVFERAGYDWAAVKIIADGTLKNLVEAVGDCQNGLACLDSDYLTSCAEQDPTIDDSGGGLTQTASSTGTGTGLASGSTGTSISTGTGTPAATAIGMGTGTAAAASAPATSTKTGSGSATSASVGNTSTAVSTGTGFSDAAASPDIRLEPDAGILPKADASAPIGTASPSGPPDLGWVYAAVGSKLCLNAAYFYGGNRAVLLVFVGPDANPEEGMAALSANGMFCWSFSAKKSGLYEFWADAAELSCEGAVCPRDGEDGNGAQYMTAPKVTGANRAWLYCTKTGCDGMAYWDGSTLSPAGGA